MPERSHPIPNLNALRAHLPDGLARDLVDELAGVTTVPEIAAALERGLQECIEAIEEGWNAPSEMG